MNEDSFFEKIENHHKNQLPFVVYSRPINSIVKCWLQEDDTLHTTTEFSESGFVFAPFNLEEHSILFPKEHCAQFQIELDVLEKQQRFDKVFENKDAKQDHISLVEKGIVDIKNGELEKVVLSRKVEVPITSESPISLFKKLFYSYKNAMVYCWYHPKVGLWLGATPELLFKVEGKQITTISLAGTQPYQRAKNVNWTNKEKEEQQIVTDYIRHQIETYTENVTVSDIETIRAGSLLHLKSRVVGRLKHNAELKSIIQALHPTPAVCGFPKQKARDFILENENYHREFYTGFLGELNLKSSKTRNTNRRNVENNAYATVKTCSNFYVNLRCMQIKDSNAIIYVGGGITKGSVSEQEWEETVNKTKTIYNVLH